MTATHLALNALKDLEMVIYAQARAGAPLQAVYRPNHPERGVGWQDPDLKRQCFRAQINTPTGTYRVFLELREARAGTRWARMPIIYGTITRSNDNHGRPGELGSWAIHLPASGPGYRTAAIATNPHGWIPDAGMQLWRDSALTLPAFRERAFYFILVAGDPTEADLHAAAATPREILRTSPLCVPYPSQAAPDIERSYRWSDWMHSHAGIQNPWHRHGLDEDENYGAGADRSRFGVHPAGYFTDPESIPQRQTLDYLLKATLAVEGARPFRLPQLDERYLIDAQDQGSVYCVDSGYHWSSNYLGGYSLNPMGDRSFLPKPGTSGWNGPGGEHASSMLPDLAWHSGDLYATEKALELGKIALTLVHESYYSSAHYFSHRATTRPFGLAMKCAFLKEDDLFEQTLDRRLEHWIDHKIQNPPQHPTRRPDEAVPGAQSIVDTWQLGIDAAIWYAYAIRKRKRGNEILSKKIIQKLAEWQIFYIDAWYPPGTAARDGSVATRWRLPKQSAANDAMNYSSLLLLDENGAGDHGLLTWGHQLLALPTLFDETKHGVLEMRRRTLLQQMERLRALWSEPSKWSGPEEHRW